MHIEGRSLAQKSTAASIFIGATDAWGRTIHGYDARQQFLDVLERHISGIKTDGRKRGPHAQAESRRGFHDFGRRANGERCSS